MPQDLSFHQSIVVDPNTSLVCSNSICNEGEEAVWNLGILAVGESRVITIDALVDAALPIGTLIQTRVQVSSSDLEYSIGLFKILSVIN